ncbi:MAG: thioredoxin family protein [bacterium]
MEIRPLDKNTLLNEALCGHGDILIKSELTDEERTGLRAAEIKAEWLKKMMPKGLAAQIAFDGEESIGFIEYMPIELSLFYKGKDLYVINCTVAPHTPPWGKPRRERIPGCGSALVNAMIEDIKDKCNGIVGFYGVAYTSDVKGFFIKLGFEEFENKGIKKLIKKFRPFEFPEPVKYENKYQFKPIPGKVVIDTFWRSMCSSCPQALVKLRDVCKEFGDKVILNEFCVDEKENMEKYGVEGITYFNGKQQFYPYELSKEKIRGILRKLLEERTAPPYFGQKGA